MIVDFVVAGRVVVVCCRNCCVVGFGSCLIDCYCIGGGNYCYYWDIVGYYGYNRCGFGNRCGPGSCSGFGCYGCCNCCYYCCYCSCVVDLNCVNFGCFFGCYCRVMEVVLR